MIRSHGPRWGFRSSGFVLALALSMTISATVPTIAAAACPGVPGVGGGTAFVLGIPPTATAFYGGSCATVKVGGSKAPTGCNATVMSSVHSFAATWPSLAARTTAPSTAGCRFVCGGGTCFVNNVALPVELLQFGVE